MFKNLLERNNHQVSYQSLESVISKYKLAVEKAENYDAIAQAHAYSCIGFVYDKLNDKLNAKKYFKKSLEISKNVDESQVKNEGQLNFVFQDLNAKDC